MTYSWIFHVYFEYYGGLNQFPFHKFHRVDGVEVALRTCLQIKFRHLITTKKLVRNGEVCFTFSRPYKQLGRVSVPYIVSELQNASLDRFR